MILLYAIAPFIFAVLDITWVGYLAHSFYMANIPFLSGEIRYGYALLFYVFYSWGVVYFSVAPLLNQNSHLRVFAHGFVFGLVAYGVYDVSNLATVADFPLKIALVDVFWGGVVSGLTALFLFSIHTLLDNKKTA